MYTTPVFCQALRIFHKPISHTFTHSIHFIWLFGPAHFLPHLHLSQLKAWGCRGSLAVP